MDRLVTEQANSQPGFSPFKSQTRLFAFIWMGLILIACRLIAAQILHIYDDAFITFRYARNLAQGHGFVYHPGEWILGTTTPGFGLLCALFYVLGLPMPQTVVVVDLILDVITFYLTLYALPQEKRLGSGALFCTLFAISPIMARISVGAMEMDLYLMCSILAILLYLAQRKQMAIVLAVLCYSLRPEALILLGLLCAVEWFSGQRANALKLGLIAGLVLAIMLAAIWLAYGQLVSQSVISKAGAINAPLLGVLRALLVPDPLIAGLIPLAILGGIVAAKQSSFVKIIGMWNALYVLAFAIVRPKVWTWYGVTIYYAILLLAAWSSVSIVEKLTLFKMLLLKQWPGFVMSSLAIVVWVVVWFKPGPTGVTRNIYEPLEAWCKENAQAGTSILAYDIGAIGYYCNVRIYDMNGLVWPTGLSLSEAQAIRTYAPDYIFANAIRSMVGPVNASPLNRLYKPIRRFAKSGTTDLSTDADRYPDRWVQDYIMLRKQ